MATKKKVAKKDLIWMDRYGNEYDFKDVQNIIKLADEISDAFTWDETVEGSEYWEDVVEKLYRISENLQARLGNDEGKL